MRLSLLIIALIFVSNCQCQYRIDSNLIDKFEIVLGQTEKLYLDEIVADFERYLVTNYPAKSIEESYDIYLKDLAKNRVKIPWRIDSSKLERYLNSNLFAKYDSFYPDSVWIEDGMVNYTMEGDELVSTLIPIIHKGQNQNIDSMAHEVKTNPHILITVQSSFNIALDSISSSDSLIYNFIDAKEFIGHNPFDIAEGLLFYKPDYSDYFIKRIIAFETAEN